MSDTSNLDLMFNAGVALAVCLERQQDASASSAAMKEVIRIFPSRPVSRQAAWGKQGEQLYIGSTKLIGAMGRGRLSISAGNPDAAVFVEGQLRGMGNASLADLVPGRYRVFILLPKGQGRQYEVDVTANDEAFLQTKPEFDDALWISNTWVGFEFPNETARRQEGHFANELSHRWTSNGSVAVLATASDSARPAVDGILYRDGVEIRRARVYTDVADPDGADKLAVFLADGTPSPGLDVLRNDAAAPVDVVRRHWWRRSNLLLGTGIALVAASGVAYLIAPADDHTKPTYNDDRTPTVQAFVGSSVVLAAGVYLWLRDERDAGPLTATILGVGVGAVVSGAMLWATTERVAPADLQPPTYYQRPRYRDTETLGIATGAAGVALTGAGIWLYLRGREPSSAPIVSPTEGGGTIGWAGRF